MLLGSCHREARAARKLDLHRPCFVYRSYVLAAPPAISVFNRLAHLLRHKSICALATA